jgi:serine/threonine-protein kinase RsbW
MSGDRVSDLRYRGQASTEGLSSLRRDLVGWSTRAGMTRESVEAVGLAAYEALANAVEHAYPEGAGGTIDLHATLSGHWITVTVTDWGRWREPPLTSGLRGRGLMLIRNLCTHADVAATPKGTAVTMSWDLDSLPTG